MSEDREIKAVTPAQAVKLLERVIKTTDENWQRWVAIGRWINERRATARNRAHGKTRGEIYAAELQKALGAFHEHFEKLSNNGTLSYLDKCLENFDLVDAYRSRLDGSARPGSPAGMWRAFEASLVSNTKFASAEEEVAQEDREKKPRKEGFGKSGHNREKELLAEIEVLQEKLSEQRMTNDPAINAERIWRRLTEEMGHGPGAAEIAKETARHLAAIGRRILGEDDFAGTEEDA